MLYTLAYEFGTLESLDSLDFDAPRVLDSEAVGTDVTKSMRIPRFLKGYKPTVKRFIYHTRHKYVTCFHSFTAADFRELLGALGVSTGDVLCVHSSFDRFLGFRGSAKDAIRILQDSVGPDGGLLMPTQPFDGTALEYVRTHPVTNLARSPSLMGLMTEILRRTPGAIRSINPTHPVALWGSKGLRLAENDWEARTPCGQGTAYHRLLHCDAKILMLGTGFRAMTFYHCVEEIIEPLMPFSPFTAEEFVLQTKDEKGNLYTSRMRLFEPVLSARRRMSLLIPELRERGFWKEGRVGHLQIIVVSARDVLEACVSMAKKGRFCYLPAICTSKAE
jgi:aminoglycoside N3'-acetyltransferase